jgi:hypothetical protein
MVKVKVKMSLWLTKHQAMKALGSGGMAPHILDSTLNGGEWSASRPGRFTPRKRAPGKHWIGGWVGPTAVLDMVVKGKIPSPHQESKPRTMIIQPIGQHYGSTVIHRSSKEWRQAASMKVGYFIADGVPLYYVVRLNSWMMGFIFNNIDGSLIRITSGMIEN